MVYLRWYHLGLLGKGRLWENSATGTIPSSSLTKASTHEARVISVSTISPITKLVTLFVRYWGYVLACKQVSVPPDRRRIVNSDWDVVPHQRNQKRSSLKLNSRVILFMVKRCSHYEAIFEMASRYYLVSMVDTCRPCTLSTQDINIKVPPKLYWHPPSLLHLLRLKSQHHEIITTSSHYTPYYGFIPRGYWTPPILSMLLGLLSQSILSPVHSLVVGFFISQCCCLCLPRTCFASLSILHGR